LIIRVSIIWENNSIKFLLKASTSIIWKKDVSTLKEIVPISPVTLIVMP
jgi:hypothetical protein